MWTFILWALESFEVSTINKLRERDSATRSTSCASLIEDLQVTLQVKVISRHIGVREDGSSVVAMGCSVGDIEGILLRPGSASSSAGLEEADFNEAGEVQAEELSRLKCGAEENELCVCAG